MKLYDSVKEEHVVPVIGSIVNNQKDYDLDKDICELQGLTTAHESLTLVYTQIASESFEVINKRNYVLYNEYIKSITSNLGVVPVTISQESLGLPDVALNHHLALEGLIGTIWEKIKAMFAKIRDSIKQFFTDYFTKLGRVKKKLQNLKEVLSETDKDIKVISKDDVPGNLVSKYPVNGQLSINVVEEVLSNVSQVSGILTSINTEAIKLAKRDVLDKEFVVNIKKLKDLAKDSQSKIESNNDQKGLNPFSKKNRELNADNKSLKEIKDGALSEAKEKEKEAEDIGNNNVELEFDDGQFTLAKKEFAELLKTIESEFGKIKGKLLVNGKVITKVEVKEDSGIEFESEENQETPSGLTMGSKSDLIKLVDNTIKLIDSVDKISNNFSAVNDEISKNLDAVDRIIKDIDAIKMESLGKYKTVLTNKVKERLNLMKTFFTNYNKVNKSLFGYVIDVAEGNIAYCTVSLKNFG